MSQPERKWREWWIDKSLSEAKDYIQIRGWASSFERPDTVRVIESAAYEELEREVERPKFKLSEFTEGPIHTCHEQCERIECVQGRKLAEAEAEVERLKEYKEHVWKYVQATGNTSPKTLGYHVAEALVMDHKDLKQKLARAVEALERIANPKDFNRGDKVALILSVDGFTEIARETLTELKGEQ